VSDRWAQWLLDRRDAGDPRARAATLRGLAPIRDRVLAAAEPLPGATLLDVGTGDGLIGLEALDRVGPDGTVIFSDISEPLLAHTRAEVEARGWLARARFVVAAAEDLAPIPDASVDVATTRSVLIFVDDKAAAFAALRRVLRPDGRISLFEPINRLTFPEPADRFWGYDVAAVAELAGKVKSASPAVKAMTDFDDRDLVRLAEDAGFARIHAECHVDVQPGGSLMRAETLDAFLDRAPNPLAPTVRESIDAALDGDERERFLAHLTRAFADDAPLMRAAVAYLSARLD
jgi:arsenite methyltransferase